MNELIFNSKAIFADGVEIASGQPLTLPISATDPVSPTNGDMYYNSVSNVTKIYQNGVWETISVTSSGGGYFVNKFTLDNTDISNKFVTLTSTPTATANYTIQYHAIINI